MRVLVRKLLRLLYRIQVDGMSHYQAAGSRVLIVANHTSFLDGILLTLLLPDTLSFVVNTHIARKWWARPFLYFAHVFVVDHLHPQAIRSVIRHIHSGNRVVIFPEGRITLTGSLMKVYAGTGLAADRSAANILPIKIDGAQYTPFARSHLVGRVRWFPRIRLTILPHRKLLLGPELRGRARRYQAAHTMTQWMCDMVYETSNFQRLTYEALLEARNIHGGRHVVMDDIDRTRLSYDELFQQVWVLAKQMRRDTRQDEAVGLCLPNSILTIATIFAIQIAGRIPVILDWRLGRDEMERICRQHNIKRIFSSRVLMEQVGVGYLFDSTDVIWIDLPGKAPGRGVRGVLHKRWLAFWAPVLFSKFNLASGPADIAVALVFRSQETGTTEYLSLSHQQLLAGRQQFVTHFDFSRDDVLYCAWPHAHPYGMILGALLPVLSGIKLFIYPSFNRHRIITEMIYDLGVSVIIAPDEHLRCLMKVAHPLDFYRCRYLLCPGPLSESVREQYLYRHGIRIYEGLGAENQGVFISFNIPRDVRTGSLGRPMVGVSVQAGGSDGRGLCAVTVRCNAQGQPEKIELGNDLTMDDSGFLWRLGGAP